MMGYTHAALGITVGLALAVATRQPPLETLALAGIVGLAALAPDIDHPRSDMRRKLGVVGHIGLFWLSHRGLTHTLAALVGVAAAALHLAPPLLALAAILGYASHLVADMLTPTGLPLLWPVYRRSVHLLPRPLRIRTASKTETICAVSLWLAIVYIFGDYVR